MAFYFKTYYLISVGCVRALQSVLLNPLVGLRLSEGPLFYTFSLNKKYIYLA